MSKFEFYKWMRTLHAYLSAFAFLALIFFSVTGILLNHPDWFTGGERTTETVVQLPAPAIATAMVTDDAPRSLARLLEQNAKLRGAYASGEIVDGEALLRFEGSRGHSDAIIDLASGHTELTIERAGMWSVMGALHRGKNSGEVWRALIDFTAILILVLSLFGFIIFFSLRFRLANSLWLIAASFVIGTVLIFKFVP